MSKPGYIALYRKIQDNFLWEEKRVFSKAEAWIDILMEARWKEEPKEIVIKNKRLVCNYGQCLYSLETWARRWNWNKTKVRRVLELFQKCSMIVLESVTVSVRITVCNYGQYNPKRNTNETEVKRKRNRSETEVAPTEEGNKEKNVKNEGKEILSAPDGSGNGNCPTFYETRRKRKLTGKRLETFEQFWDAFAYKTNKAEAADAWMDIPELTNRLFQSILEAARVAAKERPGLVKEGRTPKMAQGWITGKRWEDERGCSFADGPEDWEARAMAKVLAAGKIIVP